MIDNDSNRVTRVMVAEQALYDEVKAQNNKSNPKLFDLIHQAREDRSRSFKMSVKTLVMEANQIKLQAVRSNPIKSVKNDFHLYKIKSSIVTIEALKQFSFDLT